MTLIGDPKRKMFDENWNEIEKKTKAKKNKIK